jgi:signal transduction histidine kinase
LDVTIQASEPEPGVLRVEVVDQGIGLERKQLKKVFRRFHRVESPEGKRARGMGLGLYVVSSLVKRLKGKIQAESPGPGSGTTFRVTLPLERAKDDPQDLYAGATEA